MRFILKIQINIVPLQANWKIIMESKYTRTKAKSIIHLIWLEKDDNDPTKHEYFSYAAALFEKYSSEELGFTKIRLNNAFSELEKAGKPTIYTPRNGKVKVIRGILVDKKKTSEQG